MMAISERRVPRPMWPSILLAICWPCSSLRQTNRSELKSRKLCESVQEATGQSVQLAFADQGYTGEEPRKDAVDQGIELTVVKLPEAKKGFVLLPRRWVVERSFAWMGRFRRLARDFERLAQHLAGYHWLSAIMLALHSLLPKWA